MLRGSCREFRESFEPGRPDAHPEGCSGCRDWMQAVAGLEELRLDVPLPAALVERLASIPGRGASSPTAEAGEAPALGPVPLIPLPAELKTKLRRIPAERRVGGFPLWTARTRDLLAASCVLAFLLAPAWNRASGGGPVVSGVFSKTLGMVLGEAGDRGAHAITEVGEKLFHGCELASDAMGSLLGRLSPPHQVVTSTRPEGPEGPTEKRPTAHGKENHHGNRPAH